MSVLKPYLQYRDSGLDWLGGVPAHWEIQRAKAVFQPVDERSKTGQEELLTVSSSDGVRRRSEKKVTMFQAASYVGHKLCWPGDLVINSLWAWAKGLGVSKYHGIISTAYGVYRPRKQYAAFADYFHPLLRSEAYDWEFKVRSKGIWISRLQLTDTSFLDMPLLLPPAEEAEQIGRFIKDYDRRANRLIRVKQRLIALLNEQKQAIIQRAVTRGLDTDVPLKPSGVDWLGDAPAHWDVVPLKRLARLKSGDSITALQFKDNGSYPVYGGNGLRGYTEDYTHEGDHVLIGRQGALCGNVNYAHGRFWASEHAVVATLASGYDLVWFGELVRTMNLNQYSQSAAQPGLSVERIQNVRAPLPPSNDQQAIAEYIRDETVDIDTAISMAREEIDLIREYRTRLIADVVTGKLDVRGVAVPELEEAGPDADLEAVEDDEPVADDEALIHEEAP